MVHCVSIFSGAGGLDVGAKKAGARILACIENDSDAAETLRMNGVCEESTSVIESDIQSVDFTRLRHSEPTILIGGPPCQPFSKNGYWVTNNNRLINDDPRNMVGQFLRAITELEPRGFLFENVESILHPTNLATFDRFLAAARGLGYSCTVYRANSADFGVPQKRKRVFVFGLRSLRSRIPHPHATQRCRRAAVHRRRRRRAPTGRRPSPSNSACATHSYEAAAIDHCASCAHARACCWTAQTLQRVECKCAHELDLPQGS